ncbi:hypothetical protein [Chengkuizengella axinellae]|uniref:Radical SAM protein n=1 Tax=Chengkuizengella axinellae TaxID=3064388 RepID=A0ABT9IWM6_9BACL|nr:hypothetical protein [Chengkuizengella sp. 2205SS18-9]MDP5273209.1 hypothetical protein [Chengkuizengella sp. 2205SS18-9]
MSFESVVKISGTDHFEIVFDPLKVNYKPPDKVALIDGDGSPNFPNLALQKISAWEKRNGVGEVRLIKLRHQRKRGILGLHPDSILEIRELKNYDRVYASFIFTRSRSVANLLVELLPDVIIGGTGVDDYFYMNKGDKRSRPKRITQLHTLIENMYPDHSLYESEHADWNIEFWNDVDSFKTPKKFNQVAETYGISPIDGTWGEVEHSSNTNENIVHLFDNLLSQNGFEDGKTYRGSTRGNGYSSKGCPRKCTFCVVPVIQGNLKTQHYGLLGVINWILPKGLNPTMDEIVQLYKANRLKMRPHLFWNSKKKIKRVSSFLTISDNNFPADPTCIEKMDFMIVNNIAVNMNQGMDARLLTSKARVDKNGVRFPSGDEICERLSKLYFINFTGTYRQLHFSWDFLSVGRLIIKGLTKLVEEYGLSYSNFAVYCLSGFDTTFEEDYQRVLTLKELRIDPYVMLFRNVDGSEGTKFNGESQDWRMKHLARWTNNKILFKSTNFENYDRYINELNKRKDGRFTEKHDYIARLECFDWLTKDYIKHA